MFHWGPFVLFALINSFTPGPNVILLTSSGGLWGFRRTLPHLLGVCFGFPIMLLLVLYGSDQVFKRFPWIFTVLTIVSLTYILWLSVRIFKMGFDGELKVSSRARPMSFLEAVFFQWVNGKAWQIALMTATLYAAERFATRSLEALTMAVVIFASGVVWIELGKRIAQYLRRPMIRKIYYSFLAAALLLSTWPTGVSQLLARLR